jgi:alpha-aminoadipic semialdehyde synthase
VGKTLAFAAGRVMDGYVRVRGVTGPYDREIWEGVLDDLDNVGVRVNETW